jgi:transcriptional regulator with XRE-family HTH domain
MTFGTQIAEARKALGMSQKDLAAKIVKEDGQPISAQYLNDIEHDRRNPPSEDMIKQFATHLKLKAEVFFYLAGKLTADMKKTSVEPEKIVAAYQAFRKALNK